MYSHSECTWQVNWLSYILSWYRYAKKNSDYIIKYGSCCT